MVRCLLTGVTGFVGRHVADVSIGRGLQITGLSRHPDPRDSDYPCNVIQCDLTEDVHALEEAIRQFEPDAIIHLAATSFEPFAASQPWRVIQNNLLSTLNLLSVCHRLSVKATLVIVSSSAVYGHHPEHRLPLGEDQQLAPITIYGVSKLAVETLAMQQHRAHGLGIILVRPFNLTGPGEHECFVTSAFARQIALIEGGKQAPVLEVGNLKTTRDFTDVRDAANALIGLAQFGQPGETYNLCSGTGVAIGDILEKLLDLSAMKISVKPNLDLMRPVEIQAQTGDPAKLEQAIGWRPRYSLDQTLSDVLDYWRKCVQEEKI
jgi:GDP-4-dehydro-6-deoxy-D-mannose reductase